MKVRMGFVSNSSSTSFCIFGIVVSESQLDCRQIKDRSLKACRGIDELYGEYAVGTHPDNLDVNKTIAQHRIEMAEKLSKAMGYQVEPTDIKFYSDGGYEG
jgi:hypothetical protein